MSLGLPRSLVFWSGLLVMGFIVWSWRDSTRQISYVRGMKWELQSWASGISVARIRRGAVLARGWEAGRKDIPQGDRLILTPVKSFGISLIEQGGPRWKEQLDPLWGHFDPRLGDPRLARAGFIAAVEDDDGFAEFVRRVNGPGLDAALQEDARRILIDDFHAAPVRRHGWVLFVPYWMLLLAVALTWTGMLAWRARRLRRAKGIPSTMDAVA